MSLTSGDGRTISWQKFRSWLNQHWAAYFAIVAALAAATWWLQIRGLNSPYFLHILSTSERFWVIMPLLLLQAINILLTVWAVYLFFRALGHLGNFGTVLTALMVIPISIFIWNALLSDWLGPRFSGPLKMLLWFAPIAAILLFPFPIMAMKRKAVALAMRGDYEGALSIGRNWLRSDVYGRKFQGWVMLEAGRYSEALALLRPVAFDSKGRPQTKNISLYFYAIALMNEDKEAEAQQLLETAVSVPQKTDYFSFALADCLLSHKKEVPRAREIIEQILAKLRLKQNPAGQREFFVQCTAVHAWALASCGRHEEAEARLREVSDESIGFKARDKAGLWHLAGVTWQVLGDRENARAAFQTALTLHPFGDNALRARKKLSDMDVNDLGASV